ncbi:MAG: serine/threonine-protein kinase [Elusimicrobia bacterium]|nr:serine/threonine-protein kinase [Elusimicrobiota bacterium]
MQLSPDEADPLAAAQAELRRRKAELLSDVDRLETLLGGYAGADDLSAVGAERDRLASGLYKEYWQFHRRLKEFVALYEQQEAADMRQFFSGELKGSARDRAHAAADRRHFADEMWNFESKISAVLGQDWQAYDRRQKELAKERARQAQQRRVAAAAAVLAACGAGFWAWKRRRRGGGPLALGKTVGGAYKLEREIGRGASGPVFEATDLFLQRKVAVKRLIAAPGSGRQGREMLLAEARQAAGLKHPHIVEIFAIVNEGAEPLLVLEFVEGEPLRSALGRLGALSEYSARAIIGQVGSALDFAHAAGIVHGGLKPGNVMLTPQGAAKVMDFGLTHRVGAPSAGRAAADAAAMSPYTAPEQELGALSRESDLYSLGVMFYEAVTGRPPFAGPDLAAQKREMRFAPPSAAAPGLGPKLDQAVFRALQADPKLRFHSAAELLQALGAPAS